MSQHFFFVIEILKVSQGRPCVNQMKQRRTSRPQIIELPKQMGGKHQGK